MTVRVPAPDRPTAVPRRGPALLRWFRAERRPLPWRRDRDPYKVWVAEVILQQTRVEQAVPYFERFLRAFPTVRALARAREGEVLKVWQGAGYYARARNLHAAARRVVRESGGRLPGSVTELEQLPGVGPYIARAVASLAFGIRTVALETNGLRVAARWTLEEGDLKTARVRSRLERALLTEIPSTSPGEFNEALMELGETVCRPVHPLCGRCPVAGTCRARAELPDPGAIPRRGPRPSRPHVRAAVVVLEDRGRWLVQRRPPNGLLGGLWEFPGGRIEPGETPARAARRELREETGLKAGALRRCGVVRHAYSHFSVELHVYRGRRTGPPLRPLPNQRWVVPGQVGELPLPKATEKVLGLIGTGADRASRGSRSRPGRTPP